LRVGLGRGVFFRAHRATVRLESRAGSVNEREMRSRCAGDCGLLCWACYAVQNATASLPFRIPLQTLQVQP
jgi:hypothetical protein